MTRPSAPILARLGVVGLAGLVGLAGVSLSACNVQNSNSAGSGVRDRDQDGYREDEDCDDTDPAIFPGADELCNGLDDDCDEEIDEEAVDAPSWHTDADGDGYGDPASSSLSCEEVSGAVQDDSDCDDTDDTVNPDGTEVCNDGLDNDCDGGFNDCALEAELDLASAGVRLLGEEAADLAGYSLAVLDMDGDLVDDIVVGAPGYDGDGGSSTGAAYTLMGPTSGTIGLSAADAAWEGPEEGELAGAAVAAAGDVNNDNLPDVLVGAPMASKEGSEVGVAYLLLGPATAGGSLEDADAILSGNSGLSQAGISLAGVGDMSGDGVDDIAIGASNSLGGAGEVYLLQGPLEGEISVGAANATLTGPFGAQAGTSLAPAGDLDGDGVPDLLVGATGVEIDGDQVGAVYVLHGPIVGDLALSAAAGGRILGVGDNDLLGRAVAGVGDVNGDGLDDLLAGAPADDTNGPRELIVKHCYKIVPSQTNGFVSQSHNLPDIIS